MQVRVFHESRRRCAETRGAATSARCVSHGQQTRPKPIGPVWKSTETRASRWTKLNRLIIVATDAGWPMPYEGVVRPRARDIRSAFNEAQSGPRHSARAVSIRARVQSSMQPLRTRLDRVFPQYRSIRWLLSASSWSRLKTSARLQRTTSQEQFCRMLENRDGLDCLAPVLYEISPDGDDKPLPVLFFPAGLDCAKRLPPNNWGRYTSLACYLDVLGLNPVNHLGNTESRRHRGRCERVVHGQPNVATRIHMRGRETPTRECVIRRKSVLCFK